MDVTTPKSSGSGSGGGSGAILWIVLAGLAIIIGGFLISLLTPYILPQVASTQAQQVNDLFRFMLIISGAIFLLVQGVLATSILRYRARPGDTSDGPAIHGNTTLEFVWTAIPAVIVLVLTIYSYKVFVDTRAEQPNEQIAGVVGQRFQWGFTYNVTPDEFPEGVVVAELEQPIQDEIAANGFITINASQLHTFVGQPVKLDMQSQDVIHSFWVPDMRVKQDVIPGRITEIRFTPIEEGVFRVVCAELCGSGHGNMAGTVVNGFDEDGNVTQILQGGWVNVHADEAAFRHEFLDPEVLDVLYPDPDPVLRGRAILASGEYPCGTCHTLTDLGWTGILAPNLNGIGTRMQRLAATGNPTIQDYIHQSLREPAAYLVPGFGPLMPQFNDENGEQNFMPEADLTNIVAYLASQTEP
jgi:cytochrome c oxidase subunit II